MLTGFYLLAMLLVPYPFASILSLVFPFPTVSFAFARFYIWFKSCLYLCVLRLSNAGFVQCLSHGPLLSLYAYLCRVMLCVLRLTNISFVQVFSLGSLLSLHAYIGHVLSKQSDLFLYFLSTSKRFSRFNVPDAFYKSRKAKSQRAIGLHSCESIFIIFAPWYVNSSRQKIALNAVNCMICYIFLDNRVMTTPKRRI